MEAYRFSAQVGDKEIIFETGKLAKQAGGSVLVRCGDSVVLVTAVANKEPKTGIDFLPLTVDYIEKTYAAGKIPGGFFKREGRPSETETLTSRFIDRPIRPLFPETYFHETQVIATVLSSDEENPTNVLAMTGASAALMISQAPFQGPIAGARVGRINGVLKCNPTQKEMEESDLDLIVASSKDAVVMVEGGAREVSEQDVLQAIMFAQQSVQPLLDLQIEMQKAVGKAKMSLVVSEGQADLKKHVFDFATTRLKQALRLSEKLERKETISTLKKETVEKCVSEHPEEGVSGKVAGFFEELLYREMREMVLSDRRRIDGRGFEHIRPIFCEVGILPRTHGTGLFTRGETQALVTTTLGSGDDEQKIDALNGAWTKKFLLHYNFPPFCVGEARPLRSPGRREVGHGALAERALAKVLPSAEKFPYTIRIVSEVLESNGSSSMATVCGGCLSLMDAGVPISSPVSGIAMGLIKEKERYAILSDILGDEDHLGDMDFKVCGTKNGITALQMDIKIDGLSESLLQEALEQARKGRLHILEKMSEALAAPREKVADHAPRIHVVKIKQDKIGALIGPGGKMIRGIVEQTGAKLDVEDTGEVKIFATNEKQLRAAIEMVEGATAEAEEGRIYKGPVVKVIDSGCFVKILPNSDAFVHISQLAYERVHQVSDVAKEGDEMEIKVIRVEKDGRVSGSRKETMEAPEGYIPPPPRERSDRNDRNRGDRGDRNQRRGRSMGGRSR